MQCRKLAGPLRHRLHKGILPDVAARALPVFDILGSKPPKYLDLDVRAHVLVLDDV